ncbi:MAG TPA: hypothetical protein VD866_33290 [Urbifossiella sp.]|nr:hypothetical protein [Urbifossiella sp.]
MMRLVAGYGPQHRGGGSRETRAWERQLIEVLLADPARVPAAAAVVTLGVMTDPALQSILSTLYAIRAGGGVPDIYALRDRLFQRDDLPDTVALAERLHDAGVEMGSEPEERAEWFDRLMKKFTALRAEASRIRPSKSTPSAETRSGDGRGVGQGA